MRNAILFLLIVSSPAVACRCDSKPLAELIKDPALAKIAVVGTVETKGDIQQLRVERNWRTPAEVIPLGSVQSSCALGLETGQKYLLLSFLTIEFLQKHPANMCQAFARKVENAQDLIRQLSK